MAIVVETGAIVVGANTYVALADMDDYHADRNNTVWLDTDVDAKRGYVLKSCQHMEARYRGGWYGVKRNDNDLVLPQPLSWPRTGVKDEDGIEVDDQTIPKLVKDAQCEIALILASGQQFLTQQITPDAASIVSESVGPVSVSYSRGPGGQSISTFPMIDMMLTPLCNPHPFRATLNLGLTETEKAVLAAGDMFDPRDYPEYFYFL